MIESLLTPKSIAVIGVSLEPSKVGHQIFANLQSFQGKVYPINPSHKQILGVKTYPTILDIPYQVDLAIIATPATTVEELICECIDKKVKAIIIIGAGFSETSKEGAAIQQRIATRLRQNKITLLGPNTLGAINPHAKLNASFAPGSIEKGGIALISQSGALLTTIFSSFIKRKTGCSFALSLGNEAGVSVTAALEYAASDPYTRVIGLYLESVRDGRALLTACKKISKHKPIVLLKGGISDAGQRASLSHTAALATDSNLLREGAYQSGYTMVETIEQLIESTIFLDKLTSDSPTTSLFLPSSLMILTNAGGPGVNATDLASSTKVELASWSTASIARFARELPRVRPNNPTDLLGDADTQALKKALVFALEDTRIESILLIITPQAVTDIPGITKMLIERFKIQDSRFQKPLVVALMGGVPVEAYRERLREAGLTAVEYANEGIEIYSIVSHARKALQVDRSAELMSELRFALPIDINRQSFPLQSATLSEVFLLLEAYSFTIPRSAIVSTVAQLDEFDNLDPDRVYPLIAKTANLGLKHKAILGAVIKDIKNKEQVNDAYAALQKFGNEVLLQEVITDSVEVIIGMKRDPTFGTFVAIGTGGSLTNIIADRSYIFLPASQKEARQALARTKLSSILTPEQNQLVLLCMERLMRLTSDHPEITELEINPLMVTDHSAYVADVKVELRKKEV